MKVEIKVKMILPASSKSHIILWEKNHLKKKKKTLRNYIQISQRKGKKKGSCVCERFLSKSRYHSITLKSYSNFKTRRNISFNDLSQPINRPSNQEFGGLGKLNTRSNQEFSGLDKLKFNNLEDLFCMQRIARRLN